MELSNKYKGSAFKDAIYIYVHMLAREDIYGSDGMEFFFKLSVQTQGQHLQGGNVMLIV